MKPLKVCILLDSEAPSGICLVHQIVLRKMLSVFRQILIISVQTRDKVERAQLMMSHAQGLGKQEKNGMGG